MSCPHSSSPSSTSRSCSQCLGLIPRRIKIVNTIVRTSTDDTGMSLTQFKTRVTVDDVESDRPVETRATPRDTRAYRKKPSRRCGLCGQLNHTRRQCGDEMKS